MSLAPPKPATRRRKAAVLTPADTHDVPSPAEDPSAGDIASPARRFRLPNGRTMTLFTDRVRATPAVTPQVAFALGQGALGLGMWGLLAPKGVNRFLGLSCRPQATQLLFGAREMATGMALFSDPTRAGALWARVAGDAFDLAVLSPLTHRDNPKHRNARLALGVVLAVAAADLVAAVRMTNVRRNRV